MVFDRPNWYIAFMGRSAGVFCLSWRGFSLHVGVRREYWVWGYKEDWYDGPLPAWGFGPLVMFNYMYSVRESLEPLS